MSTSDRQQYEKQEEKEDEKVQEKQTEKSWEEKWRRDPINAAAWAIVLIWAGLVLLAENLNLLASYGDPDPWWVILTGAGTIFILEAVIRLMVPDYRRNVVGTFILGIILLGIGLGNVLGANITWAVVLIAIGIALLVRGLLRGR